MAKMMISNCNRCGNIYTSMFELLDCNGVPYMVGMRSQHAELHRRCHCGMASFHVDIEDTNLVPPGYERFLDLETGEIFFQKNENTINLGTKMEAMGTSKRNVEEKRVHLSVPILPSTMAYPRYFEEPAIPSYYVLNDASPPSSSVTSNSPHEECTLILGHCTKCLMYVMMAREDPWCPNCNSTAFLQFLQ